MNFAFGPLKKLKLSHRLTLLALGISVAASVAVGFLAVRQSKLAMLEAEDMTLTGLRDARKNGVERYFDTIDRQIANFANNRMIGEATVAFTEQFHNLPQEVGLETGPGSKVEQSLKAFFNNEYRPRLEASGIDWKGADAYMPQSPAARIAQYMYISDNPNPTGSKVDLDRSGVEASYNEFHEKYHPVVRQFLESFGYYDIFLFDLEGNLVYSVFKETDYATNFLNGPYKDSNFGTVYRAALQKSNSTDTVIEDFEPYTPSYGAPASFTGAPIVLDGVKVGVVVFQMPIDTINEVVSSDPGLGETGQMYLVGSDGLMRTDSRFADESTILSVTVRNDAIHAIEQGQSGVGQFEGMAGEAAMIAYTPLELKGLDWGLCAEVSMAEVLAPIDALRSQIMIAGLIVGSVLSILGLLFATSITRPVHKIVEATKAIAGGDLRERLQLNRQDELGDLADSVNLMTDDLASLLSQVTATSNEVASAAIQMAASSEEVSHGMSSQQSQTQRVSAAIEEMSASVAEVASKAAQAASIAEEAGEQAREGGTVVGGAVEGMNAISAQVNESASAVKQLGQRGEEIGAVIAVINDIADQTNLLALNAAIEAARAGEHGRGFAVVADEVRKLAERTTKATEEVAQSIRAIQNETGHAVECMELGCTKVDEGVGLAASAGESLGKIVQSSQQVADMIRSIAAAASQQDTASAEIAHSVESIDAVTSETAQGVQQAAAAASSMSARATELQDLVNRFKLKE